MMKNCVKFAAVILSVVMLSAAIAVFAAWQNYADGNRILVKPEELSLVSAILDDIGIPYGTGNSSYIGEEYAFIESRAELMPVIENCLRESGEIGDEIIPAYRDAHTDLFRAVICAGVVGCLYCIVMALLVKKKITAYLYLTAAFLTAAGSLHWLSVLNLTVL